ncbi:MAG: family oxidoreductase [Candidatus Krumholzibacteriota bacterium]|nr:family oxidoreductase [Candidatus Krumholzibacteriota bacterium]
MNGIANSPQDGARKTVLVTGASGYVGGRLVSVLDTTRYDVRCLARRPEYLRDKMRTGVQVVRGDVLDPGTLPRALRGVHTAYYLVHSMGSSGDFVDEDRAAARNFGRAARACGARRIIYLGGLGDPGEDLSTHLRSRHEVGKELRASGVQVIEFRASIVIGSGSLSFEMIRALTERLPVMTTPKWVRVPAQPIAVGDLLSYLLGALEVGVEGNPVYEIGGRDVISYGGLMREYARQRGLKRLLIPVPLLTTGLSSRWLGLVTPLYARVGRKLIDSVRHPTLVRDDSARRVFGIEPMGIAAAIAAALRNEDHELAETRWSDALSSGGTLRDWGGYRFGSRIVDSRTSVAASNAAAAFAVVRRIGGKNGWYYATWLWRLRGFLDLLSGGVGMRRGRRDPEKLVVGDVVDCWRVETLEPGRRIRFVAEMKVPGRAWLEFEFKEADGKTAITQTAVFDPLGLGGLAYWYALYPAHRIIFSGMLRRISRLAAAPKPSAVSVATKRSV